MNNRVSKIGKIIVMVCLVGFYSCGKEETLTVSTQEIELGKFGLNDQDTQAKFVISSSASWTLKCTQWLTTNVTSGGSGDTDVTISVAETSEERTGYITVENKDVSVVVTVIQRATELVASTLTVTPMSVEVEFDGKTSSGIQPTVKFTTNRAWTITDFPDWVAVSSEAGNAGTEITVTLTVSKLEQADGRIGSFKINAGTLSKTVAITQLAEDQNLDVSSTSIKVRSSGMALDGSQPTFIISTNKNWTITNLPNWITATPGKGNAGMDNLVTLTISSNTQMERTATFNVNAGYLTEYITVDQRATPALVGYRVTLGGGTNLSINETDNYWDIVTGEKTDESDWPTFFFTLNELFPTNVSDCILEFEYQVSGNFEALVWGDVGFRQFFYIGGVNDVNYMLWAIIVKSDKVDTDNEGLWRKFSEHMTTTVTEYGWGQAENAKDASFYLWGAGEVRFLIRNLKYIIATD